MKLVAFDVDGTLTKGFGWKSFHDTGGVTPEEHKAWRKEYLTGKIDYNQWIARIEKRYREKGMTFKKFSKAVKAVEFYEGAKECITAIQNQCFTCLASSSPNIYVEEVARQLGVKRYHAAITFVFDATGLFTKIQFDTNDRQEKVTYLKNLCKELGIRPEEIVYVGDSENDLAAFEFTGRGVLIGEGDMRLQTACWKQVSKLKDVPQLLR